MGPMLPQNPFWGTLLYTDNREANKSSPVNKPIFLVCVLLKAATTLIIEWRYK